MKINTSNYPIFFLDYHEGSLSASEQEEVRQFVKDHPELKEEFEDFLIEPLPPTDESFEWKASLRRGVVNADNLDHYLISSLEGELSVEDEKMLEGYLQQYPERQRHRQLIGMTKLIPEREVYPDKKSLKKPVPMMLVYRRAIRYAAAAIVLLAMLTGGYFLYLNSVQHPAPQLALPTSPAEEKSPAISTPPDHHESLSIGIKNEHRASTAVRMPSKTEKYSEKENPSAPAPGLAINPDATEQQPELYEHPVPVADVASSQPEEQKPAQPQTVETDAPVAANNPSKEEYLSVWEALRRKAGKEAERLTGQALPDNQAPKVSDMIGKGVQKATRDKVKYDSKRDEEGKLTAFNIFAGKFSIEHSTGD